MSEHFNRLTPAQAERLAMLAEECGEVIQIVGKILRHGYDSTHPDGGPTNAELLSKEVCDIDTVWQQIKVNDGVPGYTARDCRETWERKLRYAHHQGVRE